MCRAASRAYLSVGVFADELVCQLLIAYGASTGERIVIGPGESCRYDLGIKIREMFEDGAAEGAPRRSLAIGALRVAARSRDD